MRAFRCLLISGLVGVLSGCQQAQPLTGGAGSSSATQTSAASSMGSTAASPARPSAASAAGMTPPSAGAALPAPVRRAAVPAPAPAAPDYELDRVVVSLHAGTSREAFLADPAARGLRVLNQIPLDGRTILTVGLRPGETPEAARGRLAAVTGVDAVYLETHAYMHTATVPASVEFYPQQWAHQARYANTVGAWQRLDSEHIDQSQVIFADIDTGVEVDHPSFKGRGVKGQQPTAYAAIASSQLQGDETTPDFTGDQFGHGTFTTGIAAADPTANNSMVAGVAWGVKIMPIKVDHPSQPVPNRPDLRHWGAFNLSDIVAGIQWVADHNQPADGNGACVRVINLSLGANTLGIEPLYVEAIAYARSKGILCVASTGNAGANQIPPPANTPGVVAVGSTSLYDGIEYLSPFSNYGTRLDLVAPGDPIISTIPVQHSELGSRSDPEQHYYAWANGTSEAAPYVAGVACLMFAKYDPGNQSLKSGNKDDPAKMVDAVRAQLLKSCNDMGAPGWDPAYGWGRINADKALSAPVPLPPGPAPQY